LKVAYQNTLADLVRFHFYTLPRSRSMQIAAACSLAMFGYVTFGAVRHTVASPAIKVFTFVVMLGGLTGFLLLATSILSLLACIPRFRRETGVEHKVELSPEGVVEETTTGRHEVSWAGIYRIRRTRTAILIYVSEVAAHVIPKRCFSAAREADAFYEFALARCVEKGRRRA